MSRDSAWAAIGHALRTSWRWPATQEELDDLADRTGTWTSLDPLVAAVEYYQRNQPESRPSVNELLAEGRRRQKAGEQRGQFPPCPTCNAEGCLEEPLVDPRLPGLRPCPTCRPGTAKLHADGHYRPDAPIQTTAQRSPVAEAARDANAAAPKYGPRRRGPEVRRPAGTPTTPDIEEF